jgi:hypothetical protein
MAQQRFTLITTQKFQEAVLNMTLILVSSLTSAILIMLTILSMTTT